VDVVCGVMVCVQCASLARHVQNNLNHELVQLRVLANEAIRVALVEGRLHLAEQRAEQETSKTELLKAIAALPSLKGNTP
jgi:hypothetical protein